MLIISRERKCPMLQVGQRDKLNSVLSTYILLIIKYQDIKKINMRTINVNHPYGYANNDDVQLHDT